MDEAEAARRRGDELADKKEWAQAIAEYDEAIRLDPKNVFALEGRAFVRLRRGERDKALKDYDAAISYNSERDLAHYDRGTIHLDRGELDKAIADFDQSIRINPSYATAWYIRGKTWLQKGDWQRALKDFDEAIRLDTKYAAAFDTRALAWCAAGKYDLAVKDLDEAIRYDGNLASAFRTRASIRAICPDAKFRDGTKAIDDATRACEITNWQDARSLAELAAAFAETGQFDAAVKFQTRALENEGYRKQFGEVAKLRLKLYTEGQPVRDQIK